VSLRLRDGAMVFAVADNGIGIDIADHDRIFRRFEQIEGGSTRRYGGTGLGLSLVKVFAELMGGSVSVESALGKGATFTVRIPRMLADESINDAARDVVSYQRHAFTPEAIGHDTPAQAPARGSPHVVVAEDNRDLRRYLTNLLSAEFRVTALEDGQSAYDVIRKEHPDVVVSDVMMPLMDGFELIAKLKSDPGLVTIPVLLLTARAGAEMAADSIDRGADDYLTKPFSPLDLLARVRAAHRMRQLYTSLIEAERRAYESEQREALQKMRAELAHVNRVSIMGELAASLAHEVKQPIAAARNNAWAALNFLDKQPPDLGEVREALGCVVGDADRAGDIIDRMRDHIKKAPTRKDRFDLNEAINEVIVLARSAITKNAVSVQTHFTEGLLPIQGDRVQLQQVALNLVLNAVDAMSSVEAGPRELVISTEQNQTNGVRVAVRDSGPGVDPEQRERVFEAFYTTKSSGVGMGLSICRSIIDAHGGRLWVDANKPRGAVFQFTLPARNGNS
jgi:signal transduction histidine kinase